MSKQPSLSPYLIGLETEYWPHFETQEGQAVEDELFFQRFWVHFFRAIDHQVPNLPGVRGAGEDLTWAFYGVCPLIRFLPCGGKLYLDGLGEYMSWQEAYPEWATPECRTPLEALEYARAGDGLICEAFATATAEVAQVVGVRAQLYRMTRPPAAQSQPQSQSWRGMHENYGVAPGLYDFLLQPNLLAVRAFWLPFLATRLLFAGTGDYDHASSDGFLLSPRAEVTTLYLSDGSRTPRFCRHVIDTRVEHFSSAMRRLQIVCGDVVSFPFASFLQIGSTALMLRLLDFLMRRGQEACPLLPKSMSSFESTPLTLFQAANRWLHLPPPQKEGLIAIQRNAIAQIRLHADLMGLSPEERFTLDLWQQTIIDLEQDFRRLRSRVEWVDKYLQLETSQQNTANIPIQRSRTPLNPLSRGESPANSPLERGFRGVLLFPFGQLSPQLVLAPTTISTVTDQLQVETQRYDDFISQAQQKIESPSSLPRVQARSQEILRAHKAGETEKIRLHWTLLQRFDSKGNNTLSIWSEPDSISAVPLDDFFVAAHHSASASALLAAGEALWLRARYQRQIEDARRDLYQALAALEAVAGDVRLREKALALCIEIYRALGESDLVADLRRQQQELGTQFGGQSEQMLAHYEQALDLEAREEYQEALTAYQEALTLGQRLGDHVYQAESLRQIGQLYDLNEAHEQAIPLYQQALQSYEQVSHRGGQAQTLQAMGKSYASQEDDGKALECYLGAAHAYQKSGQMALAGLMWDEMGQLYSQQAQYEQAIASYQRSFACFKQVGHNAISQGHAIFKIGQLYYQRQPKKALVYHQQALRMFEAGQAGYLSGHTLNYQQQRPYIESRAVTVYYIGYIYLTLNQDDLAIAAFEQALQLFEQLDDPVTQQLIIQTREQLEYLAPKREEARHIVTTISTKASL